MRSLLTVVIMLSTLPATVPAEESGSGAPSILTHSPFLPPGFQPPGGAGTTTDAPASPSQYEFHGVYQLGGTYYFNLFNSRERKGSWISKDNSPTDWPRIVRYDEEEDVLVVEVSGERVSLSLMETSDRPMPVAGARSTQPAAAPPSSAQASPQQATPRRRVIRPTVRPPSPPATSNPAERRPTIQLQPQS